MAVLQKCCSCGFLVSAVRLGRRARRHAQPGCRGQRGGERGATGLVPCSLWTLAELVQARKRLRLTPFQLWDNSHIHAQTKPSCWATNAVTAPGYKEGLGTSLLPGQTCTTLRPTGHGTGPAAATLDPRAPKCRWQPRPTVVLNPTSGCMGHPCTPCSSLTPALFPALSVPQTG